MREARGVRVFGNEEISPEKLLGIQKDSLEAVACCVLRDMGKVKLVPGGRGEYGVLLNKMPAFKIDSSDKSIWVCVSGNEYLNRAVSLAKELGKRGQGEYCVIESK